MDLERVHPRTRLRGEHDDTWSGTLGRFGARAATLAGFTAVGAVTAAVIPHVGRFLTGLLGLPAR